MTKNFLFITISILLLSLPAKATVDIRLGGGGGIGVGNNVDALPQLDDGTTQGFRSSGYNFDIMMSDYWIILGARAEEFSSKTGTFFYFDQGNNQYTKYGVKTKHRTYSGLVGVHFELNTENTVPGGKVLYSAAIFGVIPFDQSNSVEVESRNALGASRVTGSAKQQQEWAVYLEANRAAPGGFTAGLQMGYKHHLLKDYEDNNGNPINDYNGQPLQLNLSHIDFRIFLGIRF